MTPHLRDWFAAQIAASLAAEPRARSAEAIAASAYDIADALMSERAARFDAEMAPFDDEVATPVSDAPHLLDDVVPVEERDDDAWFEAARERGSLPPASERPGLARAQLELPLERVRKTGA
jgi:hypothetical protein